MMKQIICGVIAMILVLLVPDISKARSYNSVCAVFKKNRLIERNLCNAVSITHKDDGSFTNRVLYHWKSGGKTMLSNVEEWFTINGSEGETVFTKKGYQLCVKSHKTGNTFCTASR